MTELRKDYLTNRWVTISANRAHRPYDFGTGGFDCPFCNEAMMEPATYESGNVRVIPNKYPALENCAKGYGIHEVLLDTSNHSQRLHELNVSQIAEVFIAIQNRLRAYSCDKKIKYTQVFKNQGKAAGASLIHSHWQILGMSVMTDMQKTIARSFKRYFKRHGRCYLCDHQDELRAKSLTIFENSGVICYADEASAFMDGVNIMPIAHVTDFADFKEVPQMAEALKIILSALNNIYPGGDYNIILQNGTCKESHFYFQIVPRMGSLAGFELGTGCYISSVFPEVSAEKFRNAIK